MDCPKCGVAQDGERQDCSSCGIIFARWREAQDRAFLDRRTAQGIVVPEVESGLPRWMVGVAVVVVVALGMMWTVRRRDARANVDLAAQGKAQLNEINKVATKQRLVLQEEAARARRMKSLADSDRTATASRPIGFSEEDATSLLHDCVGFETPGTVKLPKVFSSTYLGQASERYPALEEARKSEMVVARETGPTVTFTLGITAAGMPVTETATEFEFDLGWRQVKQIVELTGTADSAEAEFQWMYQQQTAAEILLRGTTFTGYATFLLKDGAWRVTGARTTGGDPVKLCDE